jgi:hypothetical protein
MATFRDYDGVWALVNELRTYHGNAVDEIVVVDNDPDGPHRKCVKDELAWTPELCRYVPFGDVAGTAAPRDRVFREATGDVVVCVDSHVMLAPNALSRLRAWFELSENRSRDLLTGPLTYPNGTYNTHFNDIWHDRMWGNWALAWRCPCGEPFTLTWQPPQRPGAEGEQAGPDVAYIRLMPPQDRLEACQACGKAFRPMAWAGHEASLRADGFVPMAATPDEPAFEIPACGLGLFACRRDAWLGFNPQFRGFGGEEWYIHAKYRNAGRRCLSLPFLRWTHRFGRPNGVPYVNTMWDRVRNYVIGHHELGLPLERVQAAFAMPEAEWAQLAAKPFNPPEWPVDASNPRPCAGCDTPTAQDRAPQLTVTLSGTAITDLHQQAKIGEFVERCKTVVTLDKHPNVPPCDMLVVNACRTFECFSTLMVKYHLKVRHFIAVLGTSAHGWRGEDGGAGLIQSVGNFTHHEKRWFPVWLGEQGAGLIVLSCDPADEPERCYLMPPGFGVGTELRELFKSLGVEEKPNCQCTAIANQMDQLGVHGVKARKEELLKMLEAGKENFGWGTVLGAGWRAITSGLAWTIGVRDPLRGLLDEAIRREEEKKRTRKAA